MIVKKLVTYPQLESINYVFVSLKLVLRYMRKIFIIFCALFLSHFVDAQTNVTIPVKQDKTAPADVVSLKETEYNFGKIPQGKPVTHVFEIINTGSTPLTLDNVQASCGCTTPEWSKDAIAPGAASKITVGFNAMSDGPFTKFITLSYNGTQSKQVIIKGEVWKVPASSAPENAGLNSLKNQ
jgi:hypothetical protein